MKIALFNVIKSKKTSTIYKVFIRVNGIFIPWKFKEKYKLHDTEEQEQ